ncbi:hypothetical protein EJ02DRAFT_419061 [Clathrospora elynae]|uniref:Uncharacterized protein n=1 Tax=Clathrospora elynae TaxID=706981 RepID=A0A6A5TAR3_9PLEO|nr:hypothetical protein EJ02DRAFT_419061 [Clathrospora elynae]
MRIMKTMLPATMRDILEGMKSEEGMDDGFENYHHAYGGFPGRLGAYGGYPGGVGGYDEYPGGFGGHGYDGRYDAFPGGFNGHGFEDYGPFGVYAGCSGFGEYGFY